MPHRWDPIAPPVSGLVHPIRIDPTGRVGPTRAQARGSRWQISSPGLVVPAQVSDDLVEQRIIEASARGGAVVTGWAALRLHGGNFFDGLARDGADSAPGARRRKRSDGFASEHGIRVVEDRIPPDEVVIVHGIRCATVERALFDEMRRIGEVREMAVAVGAACAAQLISVRSGCGSTPRPGVGTATSGWRARPSRWRSRTAGHPRRTGSGWSGSTTQAGDGR